MRIYLHLSPNQQRVPFNYQQRLVGIFHACLGRNEYHDQISLYSLSWLSRGHWKKEGLDFPNGATFYISAPRLALLSDLLSALVKGQPIAWGMKVEKISLQETPDFGKRKTFLAQSPILIKRKIGAQQQYYFPSDPAANALMTETLQEKLQAAGLSTDVSVAFDQDYPQWKIRMTQYKGTKIKATLCPVWVAGDARAVAFAWEVGVGNSTGIGFGALK